MKKLIAGKYIITRKVAIAAAIILLGMVGAVLVLGRQKAVDKIDGHDSASIISQDNNQFKLKLGFDDGNKKTVSVIRYAVLLFKTDENGNLLGESPIDWAPYADSVVLGKDDQYQASREVSYTAPNYLTGKYALVVDYIDESGSWPYSLALGNVDLKGKTDDQHSFEILSEKCFLQVADETKTFALTQGPDVRAEENLLLTCTVKNHSAQEITVNPNFQNFRRNYLLGESNGQPSAVFGPISFKGGETKDISLSIAKAVEPQAYDVALYFTNVSKREVSNRVYAHYIIAGESATIQSATLDRDHYAAGESANVTLSFYGSADGFEYSRLGGTKNTVLQAGIDVRNATDESCLPEEAAVSLDLNNRINNTFTLRVDKACQNPSVAVTLRGKDGRILDTRTFLQAAR